MCVSERECESVCMCTCVHVYMCTCVHVYMCTCVHVYMYVCVQLEDCRFSGVLYKHLTGAIAVTSEVFAEYTKPILLTEINCNGTEHALLNCPVNDTQGYTCDPDQDAGVVCQSKVADKCSMLE